MVHMKYKVSNNVSQDFITKVGFCHNTIRKLVYKNFIQLEISINPIDKTYIYEVIDVQNHQLYAPYYDRQHCHNNLVLKKVEHNIDKYFEELVKKKIFTKIRKERRKNNETNCKI